MKRASTRFWLCVSVLLSLTTAILRAQSEGAISKPQRRNEMSRSPSTKNGQPLELLYYAFDWAGPDVPQVLEVVCTAPKDGTPGRVVEITLAASSL